MRWLTIHPHIVFISARNTHAICFSKTKHVSPRVKDVVNSARDFPLLICQVCSCINYDNAVSLLETFTSLDSQHPF